MNAAERVRAFLTARTQAGRVGADIFTQQGLIAREGEHYLREADLEALLQTIEILTQLASRNLVQEENPTREEYTLRYAEQQVRAANPEQEKEDRT